MGWLEWSVELLTWSGLGFAFVVTYLKVNKVWIRRFDRNVADSISVTAVVLGLVFNTLPNWVKFTFIDVDWGQSGRESIKLLAAVVFFAIGIGFWARRDQRRGILSLIRRAFKLEAREAADLARGFVRPVGAKRIIRILDQVASVDRRYEESEHRFIEAFAKTWHLGHERDLGVLRSRIDEKPQDQLYIELRQNISGYLGLHPPRDQVAHLMDVIRSLVTIDKRPSEEEKFVLEEIEGMIGNFLNKHQHEQKVHSVIIVPQSAQQQDAFRTIRPSARSPGSSPS